jgi:hypothetical protein
MKMRDKFRNIITNARKAGQIVSPITGQYLELDFYIPDEKLSFEFQVCIIERKTFVMSE